MSFLCDPYNTSKQMAKILIVDDETPIRRTLRDILEFEGYEVEEAVGWPRMCGKSSKGKI